MIKPPDSIFHLASGFYQDSHEFYASMEEWKTATVNLRLPPGPAREEAKAYLESLIAGPYSDDELRDLWRDVGSDYSSSNIRALLQGVRDAFDAPYVKPKFG